MKEAWLEIKDLKELKKIKEKVNRVIAISANDLGNKFEIIYSFDVGDTLNVKLVIDKNEKIDSIAEEFPSARLFEREVVEMLGVKIKGVDKKLFLPENWKGKPPLTKDFKVK